MNSMCLFMTFSGDFSELPNLEFGDKVQYIPVAQWARIGQYRSSLFMENRIEIPLSPADFKEIINVYQERGFTFF